MFISFLYHNAPIKRQLNIVLKEFFHIVFTVQVLLFSVTLFIAPDGYKELRQLQIYEAILTLKSLSVNLIVYSILHVCKRLPRDLYDVSTPFFSTTVVSFSHFLARSNLWRRRVSRRVFVMRAYFSRGLCAVRRCIYACKTGIIVNTDLSCARWGVCSYTLKYSMAYIAYRKLKDATANDDKGNYTPVNTNPDLAISILLVVWTESAALWK